MASRSEAKFDKQGRLLRGGVVNEAILQRIFRIWQNWLWSSQVGNSKSNNLNNFRKRFWNDKVCEASFWKVRNWFRTIHIESRVASFNTSCLEPHHGFCRLLMKGIFVADVVYCDLLTIFFIWINNVYGICAKQRFSWCLLSKLLPTWNWIFLPLAQCL